MRRDENEYPNDYWDKQEQQREEQTEGEEKGQKEKPSRAPVIIILSAIALLLIFLIVALGAAANQFTQWAQDKSRQVVADVKEHQSRAEERRKQQEEQEQKEQQKQQETESGSAPAWEDEDAEYYELHSAILDGLSYQVELEKVQLSGENDQEKNLYVITGEKPVIQGENIENLDVLNDALTAEYQDLQEYMEMITGDFEMDGAEPAQASVDCYVTYMDEEFLSVVYNVRISMEYYGQVYLSCVNINMESGVVMHNLMDLIHVDDAFAIEFRERNARQNQTDSIDYMSDQEVAAYLSSENTGIAYFTPLGMEIGFNYERGWITVTYKDYEDYLGSM